jgi:hypothetical protein
MTTQKKSAGRRSHCSLDALPAGLRAVVERMIVNKEWPKDFKKHYDGTPRYSDITLYCKKKGFAVSDSAIGRFAQQLQAATFQSVINDFRSFARAHLGTLCLEYSSIQADLETSVADLEGREALERQQQKNITRIEQVIMSLRKLDGNCPDAMQGG